ncbi:hypothetical protein [Pseudomonas sp. Gutcm_11s]|uniref:hypothetical protein n=1 Tax=Pseudomonas sp. Gutcm_11s TaxID=3026088 RepID=UPI0023615F78|nr:hypothetical protein [Pseudomonas sp. Gutcm_11s]MDD0841490.1 hypothetical protein [Pseudomonas sp. Gutcm_11s]
MARSTMEVAFLGVQKTEFDDVKIVKLFYGDEPDGKTEHGLSVIGMGVLDDVADEVFSSCAGLEPLEPVRITFDVARGGKNLGKNLALHIEPVKARTTSQAAPQTPAPNKPAATPNKPDAQA